MMKRFEYKRIGINFANKMWR